MHNKRLISLLAALSILLVTALAQVPPVVRVGFYPFEGYHEVDEMGNHSGYGYEYLHEMAKTTGWTYQYVSDSLEACLEKLKTGEIDLLTGLQYTPERAEYFDFSAKPLGTSYTVLSVRTENETFRREDYPGFQGIRVGLIRGNNGNQLLEAFAQEKGFTYSTVYYDGEHALRAGLAGGEVDALLGSSLQKHPGERIIARFAPAPFYAAVRKGNTDLLLEVNDALKEIEMLHPAFQYDLYEKYYQEDADRNFLLSRDEMDYLAEKKQLNVVVLQYAPPLSYFQDNVYCGITAKVLELLSEDLGVELVYLPTKDYGQAISYVQDGRADIISIFEADYNWAERNGIRITSPYIELPYSTVVRQDGTNNSDVVATVTDTLLKEKYMFQMYPDAEIITCAGPQQAIQAVSDGRAEIACVDAYSAEYMLNGEYPNLKASAVYAFHQEISLGVSAQCDPRLYSLLDKKINDISNQELTQIVAESTSFFPSEVTLGSFVRENPVRSMGIMALIFLLICGALLYGVWINHRHAAKTFDLAFRDGMTGLWNMRGFTRTGQRLLRKTAEPYAALAVLDVKRFSYINDSYGRTVGDQFIAALGHLLEQQSGERFLAAHINADRFAMLLLCANRGELTREINRLCAAVEGVTVSDYPAAMQPTMGVYDMDFERVDISIAVDRAQAARSEAKRCGLTVVYYDRELKSKLERERLVSERLPAALTSGNVKVYYQPKYDMRTNKIIGAEALARWDDEVMGALKPCQFIPVLEKSGEIVALDSFVMERACTLIREMQEAFHRPVTISVNQSRANFQKPNYMEQLKQVLTRHEVRAGGLEIEITETLFENESIIEALVRKIKQMGVSVSVDDFGTGYSSFYLLNRVPVDVLKIDRSLLKDAEHKEVMRKIIGKIIEMAKELGMEVICEGVENERQASLLMEMGCMYAQGFLYAEAMPEEDFMALLRKEEEADLCGAAESGRPE